MLDNAYLEKVLQYYFEKVTVTASNAEATGFSATPSMLYLANCGNPTRDEYAQILIRPKAYLTVFVGDDPALDFVNGMPIVYVRAGAKPGGNGNVWGSNAAQPALDSIEPYNNCAIFAYCAALPFLLPFASDPHKLINAASDNALSPVVGRQLRPILGCLRAIVEAYPDTLEAAIDGSGAEIASVLSRLGRLFLAERSKTGKVACINSTFGLQST